MSKPGVLSMIRTIMNEFRGYGMKVSCNCLDLFPVITLICATCRSEFRMATFVRFRKASFSGFTAVKPFGLFRTFAVCRSSRIYKPKSQR